MKLLDTWVAVDQSWCRNRLATGWHGLIQGAGSGGHAKPLYPVMQAECEKSLRSMRLAGGITGAYFNTNPWYSPQFTLDDALNAIGLELEHLSFLVIDHELSPEPATRAGALDLVKRTHELIRRTRLAAPGIPIIGYSADWFLGMLRTLLGQSPKYALDGYWHARYDGIPDLAVNRPRWAMTSAPLVGKQYQGTTTLGGVVVDLNVFDDQWMAGLTYNDPPIPPKEELTLSSAEYNDLADQLSNLEDRTHHIRFQGTNTIYKVVGDTLVAVPSWEAYKAQVSDPFKYRKVIMKGTEEWDVFTTEFRVTLSRMYPALLEQTRPNDD